MLIENFSAMIQNADQAPDVIRALIDFASGDASVYHTVIWVPGPGNWCP